MRPLQSRINRKPNRNKRIYRLIHHDRHPDLEEVLRVPRHLWMTLAGAAHHRLLSHHLAATQANIISVQVSSPFGTKRRESSMIRKEIRLLPVDSHSNRRRRWTALCTCQLKQHVAARVFRLWSTRGPAQVRPPLTCPRYGPTSCPVILLRSLRLSIYHRHRPPSQLDHPSQAFCLVSCHPRRRL